MSDDGGDIGDKDRALLAILKENARAPIADIARRLGVARTTAQTRLQRLEDIGAIRGYGVRLGESVEKGLLRAVVLIAVEPRAYAAVAARVKAMPEAESLHAASGRYDLVAQVAAPGATALDALLDRLAEIEGVQDTESVILLSTKLDRR